MVHDLLQSIRTAPQAEVEHALDQGWWEPGQITVGLQEAIRHHRLDLLPAFAHHPYGGARWIAHWAAVANRPEAVAIGLSLLPASTPRHGPGSLADAFQSCARRGFLKMIQLLAPCLDLDHVGGPALVGAALANETAVVGWLLPQVPAMATRKEAYLQAIQYQSRATEAQLAPLVPQAQLTPDVPLRQALVRALIHDDRPAFQRLLPVVSRRTLAGMVRRLLRHPQGGAWVDRLQPHATVAEQDQWRTWARPGALPAFEAAARARTLAATPVSADRPRRPRSRA